MSVEVRNVAGQVVNLALDPRTTVRSLKHSLAKTWPKSPPLCQRLLAGGTEALQDIQELGSLLSTDVETDAGVVCSSVSGYGGNGAIAPLQVLRILLIVSLEDAQRSLSSTNAKIRHEALEALALLAPPGHRGACAAVIALLDDEVGEVRIASMNALRSISPQGDKRVLSVVIRRVQDSEAVVRLAALRVLSEIMPGQCGEAVPALCTCISDPDKLVLHEAMRSIKRLSPDNMALAIEEIARLLSHRNLDVKVSAIRTLALTNSLAVGKLAPILDHRDKRVSQEAHAALTNLIADQRERSLVVARARLTFGSIAAKTVSLKELEKLAAIGDECSIEAICGCLKDKCKSVQIQAVRVLGVLAPKGHEKAVSSLIDSVTDARATELKLAILRTLPSLVRGRLPAAIEAVQELQDDPLCAQDAYKTLRMLLNNEDTSLQEQVRPGQVYERPRSSQPFMPPVANEVKLSLTKACSAPVLQLPSFGGSAMKVSPSDALASIQNPLIKEVKRMLLICSDKPSWREQAGA